MLVALHSTIKAFLTGVAPTDSLLKEAAAIDFSVPDSEFRLGLSGLTLNMYLYEVRENLEARRAEPWVERNASRTAAARRRFPAQVDCGYCITAWSALERDAKPVMEEHRLLSEVLRVLLLHQRIPREFWSDEIADQMPPFPRVLAHPETAKNHAEFWTALGHPPKPSLSYVVTVAVPLHEDSDLDRVVGPNEDAVQIRLDHERAGNV